MTASDDHDRSGDPDEGDGAADDRETTVLAQGTFDLLHPGHLHYLRESAAMGDRLAVVVGRRANVTHKAPPVVPARQRRDVVAAVDVVDSAVLGDPEDIFVPVERVDPDVVALGHDQHHDEAAIERALRDRGIESDVRRVSQRPRRYEGELLSTSRIVERILAERGADDADG